MRTNVGTLFLGSVFEDMPTAFLSVLLFPEFTVLHVPCVPADSTHVLRVISDHIVQGNIAVHCLCVISEDELFGLDGWCECVQ